MLAQWNSAKIGHMLGSNCDFKTRPKSRVSPPSTIWGPKNHLLGPTSQLNGYFNGLYLWNKTQYRQSVKCVDYYEGSHTFSKIVMNFDPQAA